MGGILEKGEDYKTEFKEKVDKSLAKEIVAFANSSGGQIYIGITDENKIEGVDITNELKSQIEDIARKCDPKIPISLQVIQKEKILIVEVKESKDRPHRCSSGFYIRSGASSQKLTRDEIWGFMEEEELFRFDRQICKKFKLKEHFDKEKLFSFMDRTRVEYRVNPLFFGLKSCHFCHN
ncbi:MAG: ATP-binding protein, partial [Bdellovibrionales bacterium]|nr:ATP-binding protein [Bdellovibrionales bacterium]